MSRDSFNPDKCTGCSSCVVQCPVSKSTLSFLGPKLTGPALERFRLSELFDTEWLEYCSNCKNCDITCPFGVSVSLLNMSARAEYCKKHRPPFRDWVLANGETMSKLVEYIPNPLLKFGMLNPVTRFLLDLLGVDKRSPLPVFAKKYFPKLAKYQYQPCHYEEVILYPGCYVNVYDPDTGIDIIDILKAAGYRVTTPEGLICCGLPMVANGFMDKARHNAETNYNILKPYYDAGTPIIAPCPSCALMFNQEYAEMFPDVMAEKITVTDAGEFISSLIDDGRLHIDSSVSADKKLNVIYHAPCHLRVAGIGKPAFNMMRSIAQINAADADAGCCGISGSYGFKKGKYEIGMDIGSDLFDKVKSSNADIAVSECGTCRIQITHGTGMKCVHPLTIIKRYIKM